VGGADAAGGELRPPAGADRLDAVLPSVLTAIAPTGSRPYAARPLLPLPPARRAVVVLVDGLGDLLLRRRAGHAPFLREALGAAYTLQCGFPSTTATSMGSFGTGLPPGAHGLVGYEVLVPGEDRILNELSWEDGPDPFAWQPERTVFELAGSLEVAVTRIGPGFFDGSGLTNAALRGGRFVAASALSARVDAALAAVRAADRALVYLYWGDLDKVGHVHGAGSWQWGEELESVDRELARLAAGVPSDTTVVVTADHGMVDIPFERRLDLALEPWLLDGVAHVGGEPRAVQLYCRPGAAADVAAAWRDRLGAAVQVTDRAAAVAAGLFGDPALVAERVLPRIGDVLVSCVDPIAVVDSGRMRPELLALLGLHGSVTPQEAAIPLLVWPARAHASA
jgi:hypothetical protein